MIAIILAALVGSSGQLIVQDHGLTPGAVRTTDSHVVCSQRTSEVRNVSIGEKQSVYELYRQHYPQTVYARGKYEVDHLISLELGGSNDAGNLWPEVYSDHWGARIKDRLENYLHAQVCAGKLSLTEAQRLISTDWIAAYRRFLGEP